MTATGIAVDVDGALAHLEAFLAREAPGFEHRHDLADLARGTSVAYTETRAIDVDAAAGVAQFGRWHRLQEGFTPGVAWRVDVGDILARDFEAVPLRFEGPRRRAQGSKQSRH